MDSRKLYFRDMGSQEVAEVRRVNRLIRQFEVVFKSTYDDYQRDRVRAELKELRSYRDQYLAVHPVDPAELQEPPADDALDSFPILRDLFREDKDPPDTNDEVGLLRLYMRCYYDEFMIFLTPKKLRLDVKFSLERDKFYPEYHELERQVTEYRRSVEESVDLVQKANYRRDVAADIKSRTGKMRTNLLINAARYFVRVRDFSSELLEDLQEGGGICKNPDDVLEFQELRGIKYLRGLSVWHALQLLLALAREIVTFLSIPEESLA